MDEIDADYVCSLSERSLEKARNELGEDPENRLADVQNLRKRVLEQSDMKCPVDTIFLLSFLRARKFNQLASQDLLEQYVTIRQTHPEWFQQCNIDDPKWNEVIESGSFLILPGLNDERQKVLLQRHGIVDRYRQIFSKDDMFRTVVTAMDRLLTSEEFQVNGTVSISDFSPVKLSNHPFLNVDDNTTFTMALQNNFPIRTKAMHVYNAGVFIDIVFPLVKLILPAKLFKRVFNHGSSLISMYDHIPRRLLPEEYLPDDYTGPSNGSLQDIIERMKSDFHRPEVKAILHDRSSRAYGIDECRRPTDTTPRGSFRKLAVE